MILRGRIILPLISAVALCATAGIAICAPLALSSKQSWLVVASARDQDTAIGIANHYTDGRPRVVTSSNGWYAVVMGPYRARSMPELAQRYALPQLPEDALLSRGKGYIDTVWQRNRNEFAALHEYRPGKPWVSHTLDGMKVKVTMGKAHRGETAGQTTAMAWLNGKKLFEFRVGDKTDVPVFARATVLRLDSETELPQIVFTRNSGDNHCCTKTWIATKPKGSTDWMLLETEELDGEGVGFIDLNSDGVFETAQTDNNFLYMFDSYDKSYSPVIYQKLEGSKLVDISKSDLAVRATKQDLASLEFAARLDPSAWRSNGFLAGWVASKVRLGQGEDAWSTMLQNFDHSDEFAQTECTTEAELDACPTDKLRTIPFPEALSRLLQLTGYGPLPQSASN